LQGQEEKLGEQQEQVEKLNRQNIDNTSIVGEGGEGEESYSIAISYAYHLHMAGGRYHEKSFTHNKELPNTLPTYEILTLQKGVISELLQRQNI